MLNLIIAILLILVLILLKLIFKINFKKLKQLEKNETSDKITNKFPENIQICKSILKKLKNENVIIEEDGNSNTSLYIAISNKIIIGNLKNNFARIQTIAHECIHSIQNRNLLLFNFVFSNIYIIYFVLSIILTIFKIFNNGLLQITIVLILSFIYYMVRSFLEIDAMTRAEFVAKEYIEENNFCTEEEKVELINNYSKINEKGVITYNYILFAKCMVKVIVYCIISFMISLLA